MSREPDHDRVEALFEALADLSPDAAARRLDVECAGDLALRAAVERLLANDRLAPGDFLAAGVEIALGPLGSGGLGGLLPADLVDDEGLPMLSLPERYQDAGHIGSGGMGEVRALRDTVLGREVAAKMFSRALSAHPALVEGFVGEARITAQLEHPNIAPVHDLATDLTGTVYFTMKRIRGRTLAELLEDPAMAVGSSARLPTLLEVFLKACDAVAFAHSRGVLHRDIKPANIMVGAFGEVYLMDWGVAKVKDKPLNLPAGMKEGWVGTAGYMPPEMVNRQFERVDERADIFSLGVVLYEIVTGRFPFSGSTIEEILRKTAAHELIPPGEHGDVLVSRKLARVIMIAMAHEPGGRYKSAGELAGQVREFMHRGLHLPQQTFEPGQTIIAEGEIGETAYIITRGQCDVYKTVAGARQPLRTMGPGSLFGESALLDGAPRTATVEASTRVSVLVLSRDVLEGSFSQDTWEGLLAKTLVERFRELDQKMTATAKPR